MDGKLIFSRYTLLVLTRKKLVDAFEGRNHLATELGREWDSSLIH